MAYEGDERTQLAGQDRERVHDCTHGLVVLPVDPALHVRDSRIEDDEAQPLFKRPLADGVNVSW